MFVCLYKKNLFPSWSIFCFISYFSVFYMSGTNRYEDFTKVLLPIYFMLHRTFASYSLYMNIFLGHLNWIRLLIIKYHQQQQHHHHHHNNNHHPHHRLQYRLHHRCQVINYHHNQPLYRLCHKRQQQLRLDNSSNWIQCIRQPI